MINNLYTVNVSVSLDGQTTEKIHQFYGISNYDKVNSLKDFISSTLNCPGAIAFPNDTYVNGLPKCKHSILENLP